MYVCPLNRDIYIYIYTCSINKAVADNNVFRLEGYENQTNSFTVDSQIISG